MGEKIWAKPKKRKLEMMDQLEVSSPASLRRLLKVEKGRSNGVAATTKGHFHFHWKHHKRWISLSTGLHW